MDNLLKDLFYKLGLYRIAKRFLEKPYVIMIGILFQFSARKAIRKFMVAMNANHYTYWLEFGTLLGAVREGQMIPHDKDLDVAMHIHDWDPHMEDALRRQGFRLIKRARLMTGELTQETYKYKTARIDIFYAHRKGKKIVMYDYETMDGLSPHECIKRYGGLKVYENVMANFDLIPCLFYESKVFIPENHQHHLRELYGPDFMVPDKNWNHALRDVRYETNLLANIE
jgi:phosphorylcholine metabolism protein LicD